MDIKYLYEKITNIESLEDEFPILKSHITRMDPFLLEEVIGRLRKQIYIVDKYNPVVRPAIDPFVSSELGIYRRLDDIELGKLLNYPKCCVNSFSEQCRFGIDSEHLKDVDNLIKLLKTEDDKVIDSEDYKFFKKYIPNINDVYAIVLPSGFIPCNIMCKEAWKNRLIGTVDQGEFKQLEELEKLLYCELPHLHGAYEEYFEKIILDGKL
ncbi:hypothetical protein J3E07_000204 [Methanococcus voltae]|uniref:DUF483 domain-containing protein n=2 Tax=Methanococcus voltae TaxID=2188 RepID=A0A8J7UTZ3_METVO|nr:DUF483 domain-containing protein [Methanococcus voltae]MBP2200806.1 hypothetical protein [Methanococcus voltae]MCS3921530.1 hypothetical protein [Methanococcus voltae PS]